MNQSQGNSDSGQTNTVTVKRSLDFSNEAAAAEDEAATTAAPLSPLQQYKEGKELSLEQGKWLQQLVDRVENEFKSMPDEEFCRQLEVAKKHIHLKEHEAYVRAKECFSEEDWHFADPEGDECEDLKGFKVWLLMKDLQFETNATAAEAEAPAPAMTSPTIEDEATRQTQADSLELPDEAMAPELEPELPEPELLEHPQSRDAATLAEHQQQAQAEAKPSEPEALQQMQQQAPNTVELEMAKAETVGMAEVAPEQKPKGEAGLSPADDKESNSKGEKAKEEPTTAVAPPPEVQPQQQAAAEVPEAKVQPQDPLHLQTAAAAKAAEPEIHPQPQSQPGGPKIDPPPQGGEAAFQPQQQDAAAAKAAEPEIHPQPQSQSQPGGPKVDPPQAGQAAVHPQQQAAAAAKAAEPEIHPQPQSQPGGPKVDPPQAGEAAVDPQQQAAAAAKAAAPEIHPQPQSQPGGPKVDPPQAGEAAVHPQQQAAAAAKAAAPEIHPQPHPQPGGPKVDPPQAGEAAVHPQPGQPESSAEEEERTFDDLLDSEIERAGSSSQGRRPRGQLSLSL